MVRVLWSTGPLKADDNPYLHQLHAGLSEHAEVLPLTARTALRGTPDVFHVHWPHQLYRASGRVKTVIKIGMSLLLLRRLRARRVPVVLTVHNLASHEREGMLERAVLTRLERLVSIRIYLNESPQNDPARGVVILHPDYRDWLHELGALPATGDPERDVILFGMLRPYKGIETLMAAASDAGSTLTVTGRALDPGYGQRLREVAAAMATVAIDERHREDADLVQAILRHRLVCLPYPDMYNSGALLYALSVGRPVLAPSSPANTAIAAEVGGGWVQLYDGDLTGAVLRDALSQHPTTEAPDLSRRDWPTDIALHLSLYRALAAGARDPRTVDPAFAAHSPRNAVAR